MGLAIDFPGGKVSFVAEMNFLPESHGERISCYRVLDDDGRTISGSRFQEVSKEVALKMYIEMVTLQIMDNIFYEAQRQGRISFYLTSNGEEAINIASAAALSIDDIVLPQGTWCSSVARFHTARVCKPMLWEQYGLW
jgi:2-oxoisovalerate dehydrogenase E1 component alpha subunit